MATAPDGIISVDAKGVIQSFSPSAVAIFLYREDEVLGQKLDILMPEPYRSQHDDYMARYMATGERHVIGSGREVRARRKNGEIFPAHLSVGELRRGDETLFTGFLRDVSDRARAEKKAAQLQLALDRVSRIQMLGELSTAIAHEVNQPLTAIANYAAAGRRLLAEDAAKADEAAAHLEQIEAEARRAGEIVKRMRTLVDRGGAQLRPESINEIVREATRLGLVGLAQSGFDVHLDLAEGLPPVLADRIQIQQVVVNLLRNAIEAKIGEGPLSVHIESSPPPPSPLAVKVRRGREDEVMVTVWDDGPGLSQSALATAFEPFRSTKKCGLGVGLAICRSIVQAHGGRIWAENNPLGGASFHFTLRTVEITEPAEPRS